MPDITLGTFNIGQGATKGLPAGYTKQDVQNRLRLIAALISGNHIDVIGLQEVDVNTDRNRNIDEPSFLRDELGWPTRSSLFQPAIPLQGGQYGNAILISLSQEALNYRNINIRRIELPKVTGNEDRSAIAIRVDIEQTGTTRPQFRRLWFVTTHLGLTDCDWTGQLQQLLTSIEELEFPVLLAGDLNVRERSNNQKTTDYKVMNTLLEGHDFQDLGPFGSENFTFPQDATRKIDYIYLRDDQNWFGLKCIDRINPLVNNDWLSDHWALKCTLTY